MRIFATPNVAGWEIDWLSLLLGADFASRIDYVYPEAVTDLTDCLVICNFNIPYQPLLARLQRNGNAYGMMLLSDEGLQDDTPYIDDTACRFVARNYVHPRTALHPKTLHFGLGYKKGFRVHRERLAESARRTLVWNFMGSIHGEDRMEALARFSGITPNRVHRTAYFGSSDSLEVGQYQHIMEASQFTLCPQGGNTQNTMQKRCDLFWQQWKAIWRYRIQGQLLEMDR